MRKLFVALCIALVLSAVVILAIVDEQVVVAGEMGSSHRSNVLPVNGTWKRAPQNPNTAYIAVYSPEKKFSTCVENALIKAVRAHGLKPVPAENVSEYDLKGRIVVGYFTASTSGRAVKRIQQLIRRFRSGSKLRSKQQQLLVQQKSRECLRPWHPL